jgi:chromosome partitioning protein
VAGVIVTIAGAKGGGGKSTVAVSLAEAGARHHGEAMLVDADPQGSTGRWATLAEEADGPLASVVVGIPSRDLARRLGGVGADRYRLAVIDTPPGDAGIIRAAIDVARVVVIPVRPTGADLDRMWSTLDVIEGAGAVPLVVLSQVRANTRALAAAVLVLRDAKVPTARTLFPAREAIGTAFGRQLRSPLVELGAELLAEVERAGR